LKTAPPRENDTDQNQSENGIDRFRGDLCQSDHQQNDDDKPGKEWKFHFESSFPNAAAATRCKIPFAQAIAKTIRINSVIVVDGFFMPVTP
jgi:hypothetical protein